MANKVTLAAVGSLIDATTAANTINSNTTAIVTAVNNTLSRDGTSPNQMLANLDMNSNHILNLPQPISGSEPLRLTDLSLVPGNSTVNISPLPVGGTSGQLLVKNSSTNYDVSWLSPTSSTVPGVLPVGGTTGQILSKNSNTNYDTVWTTPSTTSTIFNVAQYGADPTGVTNSAAAIRSAIVAAAAVNGTVFLGSGSYDVSGGLNATNITGGLTIMGAGATSTILFTKSATNAVLDLTGSADVAVQNLQISGPNGTATNFGILLSTSTLNPSDVNSFINISITGYWGKAGVYIYGSSDGYWEHCQISNFNPSASACMYITNTNDLSATSSFTTIQTGNLQSGDWLFNGHELHDLSQVSGTSTVVPLFISGASSPVKFIGGVIAGSVAATSGGMVTFGGVPTGGTTFIGVQFYGDNATPSKYAFWTYNTFNGLVVQGCNIQYGISILSQATGAIWTSLNFTGNSFGGGSFVTPASGGSATISSSIIDAKGLALNVGAGGTISHSVILTPGTITGTSTSNGLF